ncbi:MAG: hypothetical protein K6E93_06915 [Bacteroidales bacterium]|nr:hypothetical protein [Bacteroidales bacterium]
MMGLEYDNAVYLESAQEARRELARERNRMAEQMGRLDGCLRLLAGAEGLLEDNRRLLAELEGLQQQLAEEKRQRAELEMKLAEMGKLSAGVAKKSSEEALLKALSAYVSRSKRKTSDKRAFAKSAVLEFANANGLALPDDLSAAIECLDDEQSEPKNVTVNGGVYNEIHDNREVRV